MNRNNTITALLETFQECKKRGERATLFLETRNGEEFATLRVKLPRTSGEAFLGPAKKKSPSSVRRDMARLEKYRKEKKFQETWNPKGTSTPMREMVQPGLTCSSVETMPPVAEQDVEKDELVDKETTQSNQDGEGVRSKEQLSEPFFKSKEEIEMLRKVIIEECQKSFQGTTNVTRMNEEKSPDNENDNNDDFIEEAKLWAVKQKQSL